MASLGNSEESCNEIKKQNEIKPVEINLQTKIVTDQKRCADRNQEILNKLKIWLSGQFYPDNYLQLSETERVEFYYNFVKSAEDFSIMPENIIRLMFAVNFNGDCGRSPDTKPDWLNLEKFKRGQKFAMDHFLGVFYAQLLSLFILFSFEEGLKPLIFTGKSSKPYTAFKRYISTSRRVRNWYTEDPWKEGTAAYNDIQSVRKMHEAVREKLLASDHETIDAATTIKNAYCPSRDTLLKDFQSACPAPSLGQCPFLLFRNPEIQSLIPKGLNQADMVLTQFAFFGLIILYPVNFGIFHATEEDLEAFCHTWRGIGYLLGIDDEFNFCRGTLNDVRQRCNDFLKYWAVPNFRELTPESEHMMRCVIESLQYYFPGSCYENCVLYLSEILNVPTPRLHSSLTYGLWFKHNFIKTVFQHLCKLPGVLPLLNRILNNAIDKALNYNAEKHEELKGRSDVALKGKVYNG